MFYHIELCLFHCINCNFRKSLNGNHAISNDTFKRFTTTDSEEKFQPITRVADCNCNRKAVECELLTELPFFFPVFKFSFFFECLVENVHNNC